VPAALVMLLMLLEDPAEKLPVTLFSARPVLGLSVLLIDENGRVTDAWVTSTAGPPVASTMPTLGDTTTIRRPALPV
jgi:hypothetical protein